MAVYRGVVKGNTVIFDGPADLADGTVVEVRPIPNDEPGGDEADQEEAFKQHLVQVGLLKEIRRPQPDPPGTDRRPIPILDGPPRLRNNH